MEPVGTTIRSAADMPRTGNASDWQHRLAAQRQEAEQLARERRQQVRDREKARQEELLESQQQAAEEQTAAVQEQIKSLEEVLTSVLPLPPMSFDRLMATPRTPAFDPGPLGVAVPGPDWSDFAPAKPAGLLRFLGRTARFKRQREQALAVARAKYHKKVTEARAEAAARNAYVTSHQSAFTTGEAESVAWFARCVLRASRYPDGFPREYQVTYDRPARNVTVEFELPAQHVVPLVRSYRYVKAGDVIEPVSRPEHEISQRYDRLISAIALRTMHEIFSATAPEVVRAVSFTGYVSTTDQATGKPVRPHLLAVSAERSAFEDLVLAEVDPATCLARLEADTPATARDATARDATARDATGTPRLELGVAFRGFEQVHQRAERFEVGPRLLDQRRPVPGVELPGHLVLPVLGRLLPGGAQQAELLLPVAVRPGVYHEARRAASRSAIRASSRLSARGRSFCSTSANAPAVPRNSPSASSTRCCHRRMCSSHSRACSTARAYPEQSAPGPARQASNSAWLCSSRACQ